PAARPRTPRAAGRCGPGRRVARHRAQHHRESRPMKYPKPKPDAIDRAISAVRSATIRLARRMQTDDRAERARVAAALLEMGQFAGGPLAVALSRTPDPRHRAYMLGLLRSIGSGDDPDVVRVLPRMAKADPSELVAAMAAELFSQLMDGQFARELKAKAGARQ